MPFSVDGVARAADDFVNHTLDRYVGARGDGRSRVRRAARRASPVGPRSPTPTPPDRAEPLAHSTLGSAFGPVLTRADVDDFGNVDFVADPFLLARSGTYHLFFEVYNADRTPDAAIGHATSRNLTDWDYDGVVLRADTHLSFPYVFEWAGETYMLPESTNRSVTLYRASRFPDDWVPVETPVTAAVQTQDAVVFRWDDRWWLAVSTARDNGSLSLYYADELETTGWTPHERNPVLSNRPRAVRPAGRPVVRDDSIQLFFQDCSSQYGGGVNSSRVTALDTDVFEERTGDIEPVLRAGASPFGWNSGRMHHIDPRWTGQNWVCVVDGAVADTPVASGVNWSIGVCASDPSVNR